MRLFDTLSRQQTTLDFPRGVVTIYVCGITPYDTSHMGHARVAIVFDTLRHFLERRGLTVRYVQNVTDIDDPLFERARRDGIDWRELGEHQNERYLEALRQVNVQRPELYIKVTEVIPQIVASVAQLVERGHAYRAGGAVYYSIATKPDFGTIFHQDYASMLETANERGNNADDPNKRDPLDFLLWQPSQPDEPAWDSPWGPGRPGWHIECSTIATEFLGPQVDIHGGGADLIFPHHACEIAQAEPITGIVPFVRAWMHVGMVYLDGEKMSKSLGNMVFVSDVLQGNSADALRLATLSKPYREPYEYQVADVERAEAQIATIRQALAASGGTAVRLLADAGVYGQHFDAALNDDFDTPTAINIMIELAEAINQAAAAEEEIRPAQRLLGELSDVIGLVH